MRPLQAALSPARDYLTPLFPRRGECDADCNNTAFYECAFARFIGDWRGKFNAPDAFFSFQVLPAYVNDSGRFNPYSLPFERAAQLTGLRAGGAVHAANTIDLGDALAPHGSVHPRDKLSVARRMSAAALALVFGDGTVPYLAPAYNGATVGAAGGALAVTVAFKPAPPSSGALSLRPAACPAGVGGLPASECSWCAWPCVCPTTPRPPPPRPRRRGSASITPPSTRSPPPPPHTTVEVQTMDGAWHNASAVALSGDAKSLVLTLGDVAAGAAVNATRGFWSPWPVVVLFSAEGLPALPWWEPL